MAKRRGRGEGTITQRKSDGRWMARVDMGRDERGRRRRRTIYGATRAAVGKDLNKLLGRSASGELLTTTTPTLAAWLETWFAAPHEWNGTTPGVYRHAIDSWIVPMLGPVRLDALSPATVQGWINAHTKDGGRAYMLTAHTVLSEALDMAMRQRLVTFNAADLAEVPTPTKAPIVPLTPAEAVRLIEVAGRHELGALVVSALALGLRIGEASGLTWPALDLDAGIVDLVQQLQPVRVNRTKGAPMVLRLVPLKTQASRRRLSLPQVAIEALQTHRRQQLAQRLRAGANWNNANNLIFTTSEGAPLWPGRVRRAYGVMLAEAKIDRRKFHVLRHSAATMLLAKGAQLADISKALGHASLHVTSDIYAHFVPELAAAVATRMDAALKTGS